jgi:hypothetical protein
MFRLHTAAIIRPHISENFAVFTIFLDNFLIHTAKTAETCSFFGFAVIKVVYPSYCVLNEQSGAVTP